MENEFKAGDKVRIKAGVDLRAISLTSEDVDGEITITGYGFDGAWHKLGLKDKLSHQITVQKLTKDVWYAPESFLELVEEKPDNLTLEDALDLSIKQWEYLEDTGSDKKSAWLTQKGYVSIRAGCFLCEYRRQQPTNEETGSLGSKCLLYCPWAKEKQSQYACEFADSPYVAWQQARTPTTRSYAASQVVAWLEELRDKYRPKVKEECYRLLFSVYLLAKDRAEAREKGERDKKMHRYLSYLPFRN